MLKSTVPPQFCVFPPPEFYRFLFSFTGFFVRLVSAPAASRLRGVSADGEFSPFADDDYGGDYDYDGEYQPFAH